jgi:hypothetical protein
MGIAALHPSYGLPRARMNQTSWLISVTEITRRSPSNPPRMQADISSENSSITARPSRSKSFSTESVRWFPSQLHVAFLCQVRLAKLAVIHFAPSAPKAGGTPSHCRTARYQAMAPPHTSLIPRRTCPALRSSDAIMCIIPHPNNYLISRWVPRTCSSGRAQAPLAYCCTLGTEEGKPADCQVD